MKKMIVGIMLMLPILSAVASSDRWVCYAVDSKIPVKLVLISENTLSNSNYSLEVELDSLIETSAFEGSLSPGFTRKFKARNLESLPLRVTKVDLEINVRNMEINTDELISRINSSEQAYEVRANRKILTFFNGLLKYRINSLDGKSLKKSTKVVCAQTY